MALLFFKHVKLRIMKKTLQALALGIELDEDFFLPMPAQSLLEKQAGKTDVAAVSALVNARQLHPEALPLQPFLHPFCNGVEVGQAKVIEIEIFGKTGVAMHQAQAGAAEETEFCSKRAFKQDFQNNTLQIFSQHSLFLKRQVCWKLTCDLFEAHHKARNF